MKKTIFYPAILSKTYKDYAYKVRESAKYFKGVHIDVMDGRFVKSKTYGDMKKIRELRSKKIFFDIHLMVKNPVSAILEWADIGDRFLVHIESCDNVPAVVHLVKGLKKKLALAVNPKTPISVVYPYLKTIDAVLVMSVIPGRSGQKFIPSVIKKMKELKKRKATHKKNFHILIDGGMNTDTIERAVAAGADTVAIGSFMWSGKPLAEIKKDLVRSI